MTTPAEKVALDVIFAALGALPAGNEKHRAANKIAIAISITVTLCKDHGYPLEEIVNVFRHRWDDYDDYFNEH
jgi:hypothetical protein